MSETPPEPSTPYASDADVVTVLGPLGARVQAAAGINLEAAVSAAHAEALDRLLVAYGTLPPRFTGDAGNAVRWAEAQLAGADVLDILRAAMTDVSDIPERLRRSAWAKLDGGLPGFTPGDPTPTDPPTDPPFTPAPDAGVPRVSSAAPLSNFPDPYLDPLRVGEPYPWGYGARPWTW